MPQITLNGEPHAITVPLTIASLLESLGISRKPVVVELNGNALPPSEHSIAEVTDGSKVELIILAAGG
jgi:sulfur carrier protein